MATKFPPKKDSSIEAFLVNLGYEGTGAPRDIIQCASQHDAALKEWTSHEYEGGRIRARQFDGFFRYTTKEALCTNV